MFEFQGWFGRRSRCALLVTCAVLGVTVGTAQAGTTATQVGGVLSVTGDAGPNAPSVSRLSSDTAAVTEITDSLGVTAGEGCLQGQQGTEEEPMPDPERVICPEPGLTSLAISLGEGDDQPSLGRCVPSATVDLGEGANRFAVPQCPAGTMTVVAGAGQDAVSTTSAGSGNTASPAFGVTINLGAGDDSYSGGVATAVVRGGPGNDRFFGLTQTSSSGGGNEQLFGEDGDDTFVGGIGNDRLDGGPGNDIFGDDEINSTYGSDKDQGADEYVGGDGTDRALFDGHESGMSISLDNQPNDGSAGEGDNVRSDIEEIHGTQYNDQLTGSPGPDILHGGSGDDVVRGGEGNDTIEGESGADQVFGENGNDRVTGGYGDDIVDGGPGVDSMFGDDGSCDAYGCPAYNDTLNSRDGEQDSVQCGAGADKLAADSLDIYAKDGFQLCEAVDVQNVVVAPGPVQEGVFGVRGKALTSKGVGIAVKCDQACSITARLYLGNKNARKYRLTRSRKASYTLGRATGSLKAAGTKNLRLKLSKKSRSRLGRVSKYGAYISVTVKPKTGPSRTVRKALTIRRR